MCLIAAFALGFNAFQGNTVAGAAKDSMGIVQSLSVFIDTIVICSCTAFVILLGDVYVPGAEDVNGVALTQQSLVSHVGSWAQLKAGNDDPVFYPEAYADLNIDKEAWTQDK